MLNNRRGTIKLDSVVEEYSRIDSPQPIEKPKTQGSFQLPKTDQENWYIPKRKAKIQNQKIGWVCCIKVQDKWRMRNQLILAAICVFIISFLVVFAINYLNIVLLAQKLQQQQLETFQKQVANRLPKLNKYLYRLFVEYFLTSSQDLRLFQHIYNLNQSTLIPDMLDTPYLIDRNLMERQVVDNLSMGIKFDKSKSNDIQASMTCYAQFGDSIQTPNRINIETIKRINQIFPLMKGSNSSDLTYQHYGAFKDSDQLFFMYHCKKIPQDFKPQSSVWYQTMQALDLNFRRNYNILFRGFSSTKIYRGNQSYRQKDQKTGFFQISLINSLLDQQGIFQGVLGNDCTIRRFYEGLSINLTSSTFLLTDDQGTLLISDQYLQYDKSKEEDAFLKFYDTSMTGFTKQHWDSVVQLGKTQRVANNNCSVISKSSSSKVICVWNSRINKSVILYSFEVPLLQFYLIIYQNELDYLQELELIIETFSNQLLYQLGQSSLILISAVLFGLVFMILLINFILLPLRNIHQYSKQIIYNHQQPSDQKRITIEDVLSTGPFHQLTKVFHNTVISLTSLQSTKSEYCVQLENAKYPQRNIYHLFDQQIITNIKRFPEYDVEVETITTDSIQGQQTYALNKISSTPLVHVKDKIKISEQELQLEILKASLSSSIYPKNLIVVFLRTIIKQVQK